MEDDNLISIQDQGEKIDKDQESVKKYFNNLMQNSKNIFDSHLPGKLITFGVLILIVFTIIIIPRQNKFKIGDIAFDNVNVLNKLTERRAKADEERSTETNKENSNNNDQTNDKQLYEVNTNLRTFGSNDVSDVPQEDLERSAFKNNFTVPDIDLSWIFDSSDVQQEDTVPILDQSPETNSDSIDRIPRLTNTFDFKERFDQTANTIIGNVKIQKGVTQKVLSDKFDVGQIIKLVYNNTDYILKIEGKTLLDNDTLLVINEKVGQEIFDLDSDATIKDIKIIE